MGAADIPVAVAIILLVVTSAAFGVTLLLSYLVTRMLSDSEWDDSNMTNALRLLAHVATHPGDFGKMYYLTPYQKDGALRTSTSPLRRPFWYINKDELSQVVKTRPKS